PEAIAGGAAAPVKPHPLAEIVLAPAEERVAIAAHQRVSVGRGVGWLSLDAGQGYLLDLQDLPGPGFESPVPLCPSSWLLVGEAARARCDATLTVVEDGRVWQGLDLLHGALLEALPMLLRLSAADGANRLQARRRARTDTR